MSDKDVKVGDVSCLGQCDGAPAISINDHIYRSVTAAQAEALVLTALGGSELPRCLRRTKSRASSVLPILIRGGALRSAERLSGLTRLGWRDRTVEGQRTQRIRRRGVSDRDEVGGRAQGARADQYVVCNADESEPGTIKDRFIMQHLPYLVVEGMIIAGR